MTIKNGELTNAIQLSSPHFNQRPDPFDISLLVIHNISLPAGEFGGNHIRDLFLGKLDIDAHPSFQSLKGVRVSAHLFIDRLGKAVQFVNLTDRAWHAGVSSFDGKDNCNDYSIGIELEGTDETAFTDAQYQCLATVTSQIINTYPKITKQRICGHSDIAPGRKTDPGRAFDWEFYKRLIN